MPAIPPEHCSICERPCQRERNFLLACTICSKGFHHSMSSLTYRFCLINSDLKVTECCNPPLREEELTSLLRTAGKPGKGINAWKCRACRLGKNPAHATDLTRNNPSTTGVPNARTAVAREVVPATAPRIANKQTPEVIELSSDDDDVALQPPAKRPPPKSANSNGKRRAVENGNFESFILALQLQ